MGEYVRDEWDGFDTSNHVYDDKKEKSFQARIWICLAVVMGVVLLVVTSNLITEIKVLSHGTAIIAEVQEDGRAAKYVDEDGKYYAYNLSSYYPKYDGDAVTLYYIDDIHEARPQNTLISWIGHYAFFGISLGVCVWRIMKIYKQ